MTKQQIAILIALSLAVACVLCFGVHIVTSEERTYQQSIALPTATPRPTSTRPPTQTPIPKPPTLTPTPRPTAPPFEEIRSKKDNMTDAQWDGYRRNLAGSIVQWFGWIEEVYEPQNGYCKITIDMDSPDVTFSVSDVSFELSEYVALPFQRDQLIAFSGQIESVDTFLGAMDIELVKDTVELLPTPTPTPEPTMTPTPIPAPTKEPMPTNPPTYALELLSARGVIDEYSAIVEGQVRNISGQHLDGVMVVVTWYTANNGFITSDWNFIEYQPILYGQVSPFKVMTTVNPAMEKFSINFKEFAGGTIPYKDNRNR